MNFFGDRLSLKKKKIFVDNEIFSLPVTERAIFKLGRGGKGFKGIEVRKEA